MPSPVKVAMIGSGGMAQAHLPGLKAMDDVKIVGFCDVDLDRARAMAEANDAKAFATAAEMLDATEADCAYVLLPPFAHGESEHACIDRGVPFFVEKPINKDFEQACGIARAAAEKGLITSAGYMNRYRKAIRQAKAALADDPAVYVTGGWIGGSPNPDPSRPISMWWVQKDKSGGQFVEQVTHTVDIVRFLCGEAEEVSAFAAQGFNVGVQGYDIDDAMAVSIKFASGAVCNLHSCCASNARGGVSLDVFAKKTAFEFRGWDHACKVYEPGKDPVEIPGEPDIFVVEDRAFIQAVASGDPTGILCTYGDALKTLEISLAANTSAEEGRVVKLGA